MPFDMLLSLSKPTAIVFLLMLSNINSLYSPYYKRCRVNKHSHAIDLNAIAIEQLQIQQIPNFYYRHSIAPVITPELQLNYQDYNYYFRKFIDSGSSGQVYLVQDTKTGQGRIVKRFFTERPRQFKRENYIMNTLNYPISWAKYCKIPNKCLEESQFNTVAVFPYRETIVMKMLAFDHEQAALIFYKLLKQMAKCHKAGIVHNDIKMGNVMAVQSGPNFRFYDLQIIDWNLARFYYYGFSQNSKRGTICYLAPESLLRSIYTSPAIDIWALGIAMFTYYTNQKPFTLPCDTDNLPVVATLTGAQKLLELVRKYRMSCIDSIPLLNELEASRHKYPGLDLYGFEPKENRQFYTRELVDVLARMLEVDPEKRATAEELMQMKYFRHLTALPDMFYYRDKKKKGEQQEQMKASFNQTVKK